MMESKITDPHLRYGEYDSTTIGQNDSAKEQGTSVWRDIPDCLSNTYLAQGSTSWSIESDYVPKTTYVLDPNRFDNDHFWDQIENNRQTINDSQKIQMIVRLLMRTRNAFSLLNLPAHSKTKQGYVFPNLEQLIEQIVRNCQNSSIICNIIKGSAKDGVDVSWIDNYLSDLQSRNITFVEADNASDSDSKMDYEPRQPSSALYLRILAGLLLVVGAIAIVAALVVLQAAALKAAGLAVAGLGVISVLGGIGLFRSTNAQNAPSGQSPSCLDRLNPFKSFSG